MDYNLQIERSENNNEIYPQLIRQLEILKYLCEKGDVFHTKDSNVKFMDKIYRKFNGSKKDFEQARALNKKKNRYYKNRFILNLRVDHNGYPLNTVNNDEQMEENERNGIIAPSIFNYLNTCWKCGKQIGQGDAYRMCPDKMCQTKYCENCWNDFVKMKVPRGKSTKMDDLRKIYVLLHV